MDKMKCYLVWWGVGIFVVVVVIVWWMLCFVGILEGFVVSNGRIEVIEVDIVIKIVGCIDIIFVLEGQFVCQGEVLVKMDICVLQEQWLEVIVQIKEVESVVVVVCVLLE